MFKLCLPQDIQILSKGEFGDELFPLLDDLIIPSVGPLFANHCHRPDFDRAVRTEFHSPLTHIDSRFLFLHSPPVADSPAIQLWESGSLPRVYGAEELKVENTDYFLFANEGMIEKTSGFFPRGPKTVKVTYTGGYLTGHAQDVPEDLRLAAVMQAKILFDRREELGLTGRSLEGGSISLLNILTLPTQVTMLLDRHRIINA
jgi:hypothetical protein